MGQYDPEVIAKIQEKGDRSQVYVGLTRTKVLAAYSRMTDLLFQPGQKFFSIEETPITKQPIVEKELTEKAESLLNFVGLYQKRNLRAGDLSFGQQKLLELAMALMNEPEMLLLDEPTAGINPTLINGIIDRLIKVNQDFGITLLVIEHNMRVIMQLAENIFCLAHGKMLANGSPDEIKSDKRVIDAYLGAQ
mgnify:CR=1 FL=1